MNDYQLREVFLRGRQTKKVNTISVGEIKGNS